MIEGPAYVTGHALRQYQTRIRALPDGEARRAILAGLARPSALRAGRHGGVWVRTRSPDRFRALLRDGEGPLPAVVTILPR